MAGMARRSQHGPHDDDSGLKVVDRTSTSGMDIQSSTFGWSRRHHACAAKLFLRSSSHIRYCCLKFFFC